MTEKLSPLAKIKSMLLAWGCRLLGLVQQINLKQGVAFLIKRKWWVLGLLIVIYAGFKAYDHFFPPADKRGGPQTVTTMVLEKKDIPIIIESTGYNCIVNLPFCVTLLVDSDL
mgnify:CR=1 FL=1